MKNILNKFLYLSLFLTLSLVISSCSDDDFKSDASEVLPIVTGIAGETIVFENDISSYTVSPTRGGSEYIWSLTGAVIQPIEGRTDKINILFNQFTVPASLSVYELAFNGKSSDPISMDITIFGTPCDWTLETSDTYGDGWNGGYVEVSYGGIDTQYRCDGASSNFTIPIPNGIAYTITYVGGGGTGGGPGWESENYFKLTAPDGTVWEEGSKDYSGIPTDGLISGGTNSCP